MTTSFYNGITGLKSFQNGIDVWGNNIANINTTGFKEDIPEFETIFAQNLSSSPISSDVGLGSVFNSSAMDLAEGSLINTDNPFDLALSNEGWFKVKINNEDFFTRNGSFTRDRDGFLVNDGAYLIGANANNIKQENNQFILDPNIDTTDLINTGTMSPIQLPNQITFPAKATDEVTLKANLTSSLFENAKDNINISALYDKDKNPIEMQDNQSIAFSVGDISYENNLFKKEICLANEDYDFFVNDKEIKVSKQNSLEELINKLKEELDNNNIQYEINNNVLTLSSENKLIVTSNLPNVSNASGEILVYKNNPTNDNEFNTLSTFAEKLKEIINNPDINIEITNGSIEITNNSNTDLITHFYQTLNSNDKFFNNLASITNDIPPQNITKSAEFYETYQQFSGYIYDKDGNKHNITFNFTKKSVLPTNTIWQADITIDNNTFTQDFEFDKDGYLISPTQVTLTTPQNITINMDLSAFEKLDTSYIFTQNGEPKGDLTNYQVDENGNIWALFSNEKSAKIATIPVYHFQNDQGLESIGGNLFKETSNSNTPLLYQNNGEYISGSKVLSNMLETSNVNLSQAMTELIVTQKAFSAAAKTVTTSDEMVQKAINMKR